MTRHARQFAIDPAERLQRPRWCARGTTTIELLVSFTLLTTTLAVATPLVVRHGRILESARHYRLALDELSNQVERLTALAPADLEAELKRLAPSPFTAARLHGAELKGSLEAADIGSRLKLEVIWDEPGRRAAPVTLVAWIFPDAKGASESSQGEAKP